MKAKTKRLTIKDLKELIDELSQRGYRNEEAARERITEDARRAENLRAELLRWKYEMQEALAKTRLELTMERLADTRTSREGLVQKLKNLFCYGFLLIVLIQIVTNLI